MDDVTKLRSAIAQLEADARQFVASAATAGRFDDLVHLASVAKDISALAAKWASNVAPAPAPSFTETADNSPTQSSANRSRRLQNPAPPRKGDYPQFVRERDELIKLGWSSGAKKPYEHRVSKGELDVIAKTVAAMGKSGQRFSMDEVLKTITAKNGHEAIPSYQAYAVVSWLKRNGMLLQHGRQGYTVVRPQTFNESVQTAWQALDRR